VRARSSDAVARGLRIGGSPAAVQPALSGADSAAPRARRSPPPAAGGSGHHDRARRGRDPRLAFQDQPHGARPGRVQGARHLGPADPVQGRPGRGARGADAAGPRVGHAGLVAGVRGHPAALGRAVLRPRGRGHGHQGVRAPVRPRPAADPGLRSRGHPAGQPPSRRRGPPQGRGQDRPPADPGPGAAAHAVGGDGRERAAPGHRRPRRHAGAARAPDGDVRASRGHAADPAVLGRRAPGHGRPVHDPPLYRARPARRRLHRAAHQRPLPRQDDRGGQLPRGHRGGLPAGRVGVQDPGPAQGRPRRDVKPTH